MKTLIIFFFILGFCSPLQNDNNLEKTLIGKWVYEKTESGKTYFKKRAKFHPEKPGIRFATRNRLVMRQNSSWCGTPPISFEYRKGIWEITSDSTIHLQYKNKSWDGNDEEHWLVIDSTKEKLVVSKINNRNTE